MAEQHMIHAVQEAIDHAGIDDTIVEVGQFQPRGSVGSMFAGGMIGGELGGALGGIGDAIGTGAGTLGGMHANAQSRGLPSSMLVGASESTVYGFKMASGGRRKEPHELVFLVARAGLQVKVLGRVNVRILELIDEASGSRIELEGNRLPITHSHDLIRYLAGADAVAASDVHVHDSDRPTD